MENWFASDPHFGHYKLAEIRGFKSAEEMNGLMITNWNSRVAKNDHVYLLGDVSFMKPGQTIDLLDSLNGKIHLIKGNHDTRRVSDSAVANRFASIQDYMEIKPHGTLIIMCHYPFAVWKNSHYGSWHLHGHSHGSLKEYGKRLDLCVECHGYAPINYGEIATIMKQRAVSFADYHRENREQLLRDIEMDGKDGSREVSK